MTDKVYKISGIFIFPIYWNRWLKENISALKHIISASEAHICWHKSPKYVNPLEIIYVYLMISTRNKISPRLRQTFNCFGWLTYLYISSYTCSFYHYSSYSLTSYSLSIPFYSSPLSPPRSIAGYNIAHLMSSALVCYFQILYTIIVIAQSWSSMSLSSMKPTKLMH